MSSENSKTVFQGPKCRANKTNFASNVSSLRGHTLQHFAHSIASKQWNCFPPNVNERATLRDYDVRAEGNCYPLMTQKYTQSEAPRLRGVRATVGQGDKARLNVGVPPQGSNPFDSTQLPFSPNVCGWAGISHRFSSISQHLPYLSVVIPSVVNNGRYF